MLITWGSLVLLACCDLKFHLIPKRLNFLTLGALIPFLSPSGFLWAASIYLFYCVLFRVSRGGLGYGDVRLAPVAVMVLPGVTPVLAHLIAWVIAGGFALKSLRMRERRLPFAPALLASIILLRFFD